MTLRAGACLPVLLAGLLIGCLALQGCVATTLAGATLGVAGATVRTAAKVTIVTVKAGGKVAGAAVHVAANAARHPAKPPSSPQ